MPEILDKIVTTKDILEAIRALNLKESRPDSDYYIAKMLQVPPTTISGYFTRNGVMSDFIAIRACELLDWPSEFVLTCLCLEASKKANRDNVSRVWEKMLAGKTAVFALFLSVLSLSHPFQNNIF